jgi:hypothetical protein
MGWYFKKIRKRTRFTPFSRYYFAKIRVERVPNKKSVTEIGVDAGPVVWELKKPIKS